MVALAEELRSTMTSALAWLEGESAAASSGPQPPQAPPPQQPQAIADGAAKAEEARPRGEEAALEVDEAVLRRSQYLEVLRARKATLLSRHSAMLRELGIKESQKARLMQPLHPAGSSSAWVAAAEAEAAEAQAAAAEEAEETAAQAREAEDAESPPEQEEAEGEAVSFLAHRRALAEQTEGWELHELWRQERVHMEAATALHGIEEEDGTVVIASAAADGNVIVQAMLDPSSAPPGGAEPTFLGLVSTGSSSCGVQATALLRAPGSPDGGFLTAMGGDMDEVLLWKQQGTMDGDEEPWCRLPVTQRPVVALAAEPAGGRLAAAARHVVVLWSVEASAARCVRELEHTGRVDGVRMPQHDTVATLCTAWPGQAAGPRRWITIWDFRAPTAACQMPAVVAAAGPSYLEGARAGFDAVHDASTGTVLLAAAAGAAFEAWDLRHTLQALAHNAALPLPPGAEFSAAAVALDPAGSGRAAVGCQAATWAQEAAAAQSSRGGSHLATGAILLGCIDKAEPRFSCCRGGPRSSVPALQWVPFAAGHMSNVGARRGRGSGVLVAALADGSLWAGCAVAAASGRAPTPPPLAPPPPPPPRRVASSGPSAAEQAASTGLHF